MSLTPCLSQHPSHSPTPAQEQNPPAATPTKGWSQGVLLGEEATAVSSPSPSSGGHPLPWPWLDHPSPAQDTKCSMIIILSPTIIIRNIPPHFENLISLNTHTICCEKGFTLSILWVSRQAQKGRDPSTVSQLTKVAVLGPEFKLSLTPTQGSYPSDVAASPMLTFPYHSLISSPPSPGSLPGLTQLSPAVRLMRYNPVRIVMMTVWTRGSLGGHWLG